MEPHGARNGNAVDPHDFAGFWIRFGADLLDGACYWGIGLAAWLVIDKGMLHSQNDTVATWIVFAATCYNAYYLLGTRGQSWGRRNAAIKVVSAGTLRPIGIWRALLRAILAATVSAIPFMLGFLWMLWDPKKQTWHDKIVGSYVLRA